MELAGKFIYTFDDIEKLRQISCLYFIDLENIYVAFILGRVFTPCLLWQHIFYAVRILYILPQQDF